MKLIDVFKPGIRKPERKLLLATIFIFTSAFTMSHAQTITGGNLLIGTGAVVNSNYDLSIQSGGALDVQGTLILKKNLINQNTTANSLGTGLIELSGTTPQTVSGQNIIQDLRINNIYGVTISGNTRVNGALKLKNGVVSLGSNHLLLGPAATDSMGTPAGATSWVDVTGTGEFRKEFSAPGSFTYPVGDNTGTAEYSPVTANFTSGTFGTDNYLGVTLQNSPDPDPNIATGDFLSRYWTLNNNGITGTISCGLTFNFVPADVNGTPANLYCVKTDPGLETYNAVSGNQLTGTVSSFSRFTGADAAMQANLKVFLQGPYVSADDHMTDSLALRLPLGDRSDLANFPSSQPYNGTPWFYAGTESVTSLPANVVDWVLVELRQADKDSNATTVFASRAGFLLQDGSIVDLDGTSHLKFYNAAITQNLYPVIRHRNHMAVMATNAVTKDGTGSYAYDYSTGSSQVWGGIAGLKQIDTSPVRWGMVAGDANGDNSVFNNDYTSYYVPTFYYSKQYRPADFNMDLDVFNNDYSSFYIPNYFIDNQLP